MSEDLEIKPWWEDRWDLEFGVRTHTALTEYLRQVNAYNEAVQKGSADENAFKAWRTQIQDARDAVEEQQRGPREAFEEIFHHLDRYDAPKLTVELRRYESYLAELPTDFVDPPFVEHRKRHYTDKKDNEGRALYEFYRVEPPLVQQRRFLENAIREMKLSLADRPPPKIEGKPEEKPPPTPAEIIAGQIRQKVELEAQLRRQCEEDVQKYPDQEETIRRSYRRAIDALREQT